MKHYIFLLILLLFGGCDFDGHLDSTPKDSLTEGSFYSNEAQLEAAVNDVYRQLGRLYDAEGIPSLFGELFSDNGGVVAQLPGNAYPTPISRHEINANNGLIEDAWDTAFNAIFVINNAIYQVENTELSIDEDLKSRWIAESLVVRALAYFNLVRAFGDVPLITERISPSESYSYVREDETLIYNQIISDLDFSKSNLEEAYTGSDVGRITRYGAAAVLAKVYLTSGDPSSAEAELEFIINSGRYSLDTNNDGVIDINDYNYLFAADTKNSQSSVLEVQYHSGVNAPNSAHQVAFSPFTDSFDHPMIDASVRRGDGFNTPTDDLADEFEEDDLRKDVTIMPGFLDATGAFVDYPFTLKFFDPNWDNAGQNFEIIRYADILLMYAEVKQDANYLNMVRDRAGLPHYGSSEYPSDLYPTLDLAIEHERRVELAMEMHRMFDLLRTDRAVEVMENKAVGFRADRLHFPIPLSALDTHPSLNQNFGY